MSIRSLLSGIKPRTKTVQLTPEFTVTLHEFNTAQRMAIEDERREMLERADKTVRDENIFVAKVVAMSMLGTEPEDDDITAITELCGLEQITDLYFASLQFDGLASDDIEDARKN